MSHLDRRTAIGSFFHNTRLVFASRLMFIGTLGLHSTAVQIYLPRARSFDLKDCSTVPMFEIWNMRTFRIAWRHHQVIGYIPRIIRFQLKNISLKIQVGRREFTRSLKVQIKKQYQPTPSQNFQIKWCLLSKIGTTLHPEKLASKKFGYLSCDR